MNTTTDFERTLATWLERGGPDDVSERVVEAALADARTVRQRPAWLTSIWWASQEGAAVKRTDTTESVPTTHGSRLSGRLVWVVILIGVILALMGGLLAAGGPKEREGPLVSEVTPSAETTMPSASPPLSQLGPPAPRILVAVSAAEAWAVDDGGLWHFVEGGWYGPMNPGVRLPQAWYDLALDGEGTAWLAGDAGLWGLTDGLWTNGLYDRWYEGRFSNAVPSRSVWRVVRAPDRGVWASSESGQIHVSGSGDQLVRSEVRCPMWGSLQLAVSRDGLVFGGGNGYGAGFGLVTIDDERCERVYPLGETIDHAVGLLASDPLGGVVATLYEFDSEGGLDFTRAPNTVVRFDGTGWSVLATGTGWPADVVGPTGETWRLGWRTIVRLGDLVFDPDFTETMETPIAIAPDGTIWYSDMSGIKRQEAR